MPSTSKKSSLSTIKPVTHSATTNAQKAAALYGRGAVNKTPTTAKKVPQTGATPTRKAVPAKATHAGAKK
jgi:hypothetical protein